MKKVLCFVLSMLMLCSATATLAADFTDVNNQSYAEAVEYLFDKGIVNGRSENRYEPDASLTRAEMVAIILRAYGSEATTEICKFTDVPTTHWAYEYITTAYAMGIINGMTETTFAPDTPVTYEQAVKMMVCAMGMEADAIENGGYPDGYLSTAEKIEVTTGVEAEIKKPITRGAMAQLVYNCLTKDGDSLSYLHNWDEYDEDFQWISKERMRGMYGALGDLTKGEKPFGEKLFDAGINTVYLNLLGPTNEEEIHTFVKKCISFVESYDIHTFIKINFGDNGYVRNDKFGKYHPGNQSNLARNTPDMLSEEYWEKQILEQALVVAQYPEIEGIVLDFEMYSGGTSNYPSPCMCDNCWKKYHESGDYDDDWQDINIEERNAFITEVGEYEDYKLWQVDEVQRICQNIRDKVYEANPKIKFAYMPSFEWLPGITRGLGTETRPVIILSEDEYWGSFADTASRMIQLKEEDYPAVYLPGLYTSTSSALSAEKTEEKINECATSTAGYWIYSAGVLANETEENLEHFFDAIAIANLDLDELLESGEIIPFQEYEVNEYIARMIEGDEPTEQEWKDAVLTEMFVNLRDGSENVPVKAQAKILYSDNELFVRCIGYDDMIGFDLGTKSDRDGNLWSNSCFEVYWKFEDASPSVQVVADAAGSIYDAFCSGIGTRDAAVDYEEVSTSTEIFEDRWEITFRIPGSMDGVRKIEPGDVLRMEISKNTPGKATSCWAPTYGSFLGAKSLWGIVVLD